MTTLLKTTALLFIFTAPLFADDGVVKKPSARVAFLTFRKTVWVDLPRDILGNNLLYIITIRDINTKNYVIHSCVSRHNAIRISTLPGSVGKDIKLPIGKYEYIIEVTPLTPLDMRAVAEHMATVRPGKTSKELIYPLISRNIINKTGWWSFEVNETPTKYMYGISPVYAILSFFRKE